MDLGASPAGLPAVVDRLERARAGITDLSDVNAELAAELLADVTPYVPRRTGALAASGQPTHSPTSWGVEFTKPYGVFHRPWLAAAAARAADDQATALTAHIQRLLDG